MAEVKNGVLKYYDEETGNWITLKTNPIAQEVVRIMKEDWLAYKGQLDCWLLKYTTEDDPNLPEPIYVAIFVDSESVKNYDKETLEWNFKDYINALSNKKNFKLNDFIKYCEDSLIDLPQQFKLNVDLELESNQLNYKELNSITNSVDVVSVLANNEQGTLTANYIYNGHSVPEKQYTFKANQ